MIVTPCTPARIPVQRGYYALIQTRTYRQQVAEAIVRGLLAYYGQDTGAASQQVAASAK